MLIGDWVFEVMQEVHFMEIVSNLESVSMDKLYGVHEGDFHVTCSSNKTGPSTQNGNGAVYFY